jgi:hypothetical protein
MSFQSFFYQHFVEKYSVNCAQMTKDAIGNQILVQVDYYFIIMFYDVLLYYLKFK